MTRKKYKDYNNSLKYNKEDIKKVTSQIQKKGYGLLKSVISIKKCNEIIANLKTLQNSHSRRYGKSNIYKYKEEADNYHRRQILIRNLILEKPEIFMPVISLSPVLNVVSNIFRDQFIMGGCQASNSLYSKDVKYELKRHIDSYAAEKDVHNTLQMLAVICLNDFNTLNGSTKIWPKSHKSGIAIHKHPSLSKKFLCDYKDLIAPQGSIAFLLGQTWHAIGKNVNNQDRWGILVDYRRWWMKPAFDFTKCGEKIFNRLTIEQKILLGFTSIVPKHNNKNRFKTLIKENQIPRTYKEALSY